MLEFGWFKVPGKHPGARSLEEQMMGLEPVLASVRDATVLDLGCAEGLIAIEMAKAGAKLVHGIETNLNLVLVAQELVVGHKNVTIFCRNLNDGLPAECLPSYDVVLLLSILHKLHDPHPALIRFANVAKKRIAIRLPFGSTGFFGSKFKMPNKETQKVAERRYCDTSKTLLECGFVLESVKNGPRGELVTHWVRS